MQHLSGGRLFLLVLLLFINVYAAWAQKSGQALIDSLQTELRQKKEDSSRVLTLEDIGYEYAIMGKEDTARSYFGRSMALSRKIGWQRGVGGAHSLLAFLAMKKSDFAAAIRHCDSSYDANAQVGWKLGMANALNTKGVAFQYLGLPAEALTVHFRSLDLKTDIKDTLGLVRSYINIGNCHSAMKDDTKALAMYNKALEIGKDADIGPGLLPVFVNAGQIYAERKQFDTAGAYFEEAEALSQRFGDVTVLGEIYNCKGGLCRLRKDFNASFRYYNEALKMDTRLGNALVVAMVRINLGKLYREVVAEGRGNDQTLTVQLRGDKQALLENAKREFRQALDISTGLKDRLGIMTAYQLLSETEEDTGDSEEAFAHFKAYTRYKDSIYNDENKNKFAGLEMKYLEDSKNKEISLLNKDKALQAAAINQKNQTILFIILSVAVLIVAGILLFWSYNRRKKAYFARQVTEMENQVLRLQMNPHFIFNSLQAINHYVMHHEKEKASDYLSRFARLMRLTLQNTTRQEIALAEDLHALELYMQLESMRFPYGFSYTIETAPDIDPDNTLVPPMLLQPFVENAIIHGISGKTDGVISVRISLKENMLQYTLTDNGKGLVAETDNPSPESEGPAHISMGVKITKERLRIMERQKGTATRFEISGDPRLQTGVKVEMALPYEPAF